METRKLFIYSDSRLYFPPTVLLHWEDVMDKTMVLSRLGQDKPQFHYMSESGVQQAALTGITVRKVTPVGLSGRGFCSGSQIICPAIW
jgi:hypothetical protein